MVHLVRSLVGRRALEVGGPAQRDATGPIWARTFSSRHLGAFLRDCREKTRPESEMRRTAPRSRASSPGRVAPRHPPPSRAASTTRDRAGERVHQSAQVLKRPPKRLEAPACRTGSAPLNDATRDYSCPVVTGAASHPSGWYGATTNHRHRRRPGRADGRRHPQPGRAASDPAGGRRAPRRSCPHPQSGRLRPQPRPARPVPGRRWPRRPAAPRSPRRRADPPRRPGGCPARRLRRLGLRSSAAFDEGPPRAGQGDGRAGRAGGRPVGRQAGRRVAGRGERRSRGSGHDRLRGAHGDLQRGSRVAGCRRGGQAAARRSARGAVRAPRLVDPRRRVVRRDP